MSNRVVQVDPALKTDVDYAVITLNYDLVFETTAKFLGTFFIDGNRFGFQSDFTANQSKDIRLGLR
jgi:hypothetical protein